MRGLMGKRKPVTAGTIGAVAAEMAGHPLDDARAEAYAAAYEPILQAIAGLRTLPMKDVEPAVVFKPFAGPTGND